MSVIRKIRRFYIVYKFFIFATGILFLSLIYLLFFSPVFEIKELNFNNTHVNEVVENIIKSSIIDSNIFLFSVSNYRKNILNRFPEIENFFIKKDYISRKVSVEIINRIENGIWCENDFRCFYFDNNGIIFKEAPRVISGSMFILVNEYSSSTETIILPKNIFDDGILDFIHKLFYLFKEFNLTGKFLINDFDNELIFETVDNVEIIFNKEKISEYKEDILRALFDSLKDKFNTLEYIDLRVVDRVFYKVKSNK